MGSIREVAYVLGCACVPCLLDRLGRRRAIQITADVVMSSNNQLPVEEKTALYRKSTKVVTSTTKSGSVVEIVKAVTAYREDMCLGVTQMN